MLVVRPEDASPATLYPDNQLAGRVVSLAFQGRCWRLSVDIGGERVRLDWPHPVPLGDNLAFSLAPNRCTLVAADQ